MKFYEFDKLEGNAYEMNFLVSALPSKGSYRSLKMGNIYSDGKTLHATDGNRLHTFTPDSCLELGYYRLLKKSKNVVWLASEDVDIDPINYSRVLNVDKEYTDFKCPLFDGRVVEVIKSLSDGQGLNLKYLKDAIDNQIVTSFHAGNNIDPTFFKGEKVKAVIMPLSL